MKNKNKKILAPLPLFDTFEYIKKQPPPSYLSSDQNKDFLACIGFLKSYIGSSGTFNSYRREIERFFTLDLAYYNKINQRFKKR